MKFESFVVIVCFLLIAGAFMYTCDRTADVYNDTDRPLRAVQVIGWKDAYVQSRDKVMWTMFSPCGRGDVVAFNVYGTSASGEKSDAVVCCGINKGCTVRSQ